MFNFMTNENWGPKEEPNYYAMGKFIHKILNFYYKAIKDGTDILQAIEDAIAVGGAKYANETSLEYEQIQFGLNTAREYLGFYMDDKLIARVIDSEKTLSKVIYEDDAIVILYEGTPDLIFENFNGDTEIMDHKTETARRRYWGLDNQFQAYPFMCGVTRIYRNAIGLQKTKAPHDKFYREMFNYPIGGIESWKNNMAIIGRRIINAYKEGVWEGHYSQCEGNKIFRAGCIFLDVCRMDRANWAYELETEFAKVSGIYY